MCIKLIYDWNIYSASLWGSTKAMCNQAYCWFRTQAQNETFSIESSVFTTYFTIVQAHSILETTQSNQWSIEKTTTTTKCSAIRVEHKRKEKNPCSITYPQWWTMFHTIIWVHRSSFRNTSVLCLYSYVQNTYNHQSFQYSRLSFAAWAIVFIRNRV